MTIRLVAQTFRNFPTQVRVKTDHSTHAHAHNHFTALFWDHPGQPVPEENFWTLWCMGRLTEADTDRPAGRHSIWTNQCPPHPPIFYRPDALPATHPTVSKHCWLGGTDHNIVQKNSKNELKAKTVSMVFNYF